MGRSTKSAWLEGPGDLEEADVEDVPAEGQSIRVRGLPAAFSRDAISDAIEQRQVGDTQFNSINSRKLGVLQFAHGSVDPKFTVEEADQVAQRFGPAFEKVVGKIDELSGVDKEGIEKTEARFQSGGNGTADQGEAGVPAPAAGSGGPAVPSRAGA